MRVVALAGIVVSAACIAFVEDWWRLLPSLLTMIVFVLIVAWAVRPRSGATKIRIAALMLCFATFGHAAYFEHLLIQVINHIGPRLISTFTPLPVPKGIQWQLLLYDAVVIFIVFHYTRESVLPQPAPLQKNSSLRLPGFQERFDQAVQLLKTHLTTLNRSLDWSEGRFVELEAELEESGGAGKRIRVRRLVDTLRRARGREIVLVLGEPGSGKSVALRGLALKLLAESRQSEILTVYLNLREWPCPAAWTSDNLPPAEEVTDSLWEWIKSQMRRRIDGAGESFVDLYADDLLLSGRLFFLLDSFDETRALLDLPKENALVERLAEGARRLLHSGTNAHGIVASRFDRSPARWLNADRWYELRPLEDRSIDELMRLHFKNDRSTLKWLRSDEKYPTLPRNPFEVYLIAEHLEKRPRDYRNHPIFPENRAEAYRSCLHRRLVRVHEWLERHATSPQVPAPSVETLETWLFELAESLYTGPRGLEVAIRDLPTTLGAHFDDAVVCAFVEARLLRAGEGVDRTVSFIHSRFGEALAAQTLLAKPEHISFEDIPMVGRWRDVLVVFVEIGDRATVDPLAQRCFVELEAIKNERLAPTHPKWSRAIRCFRFLDEACRYRREVSEPFARAITDMMQAAARFELDPLTSKLLLEGLSLARRDQISGLLADAIRHPHPAVRESALWSCRFLTSADAAFFVEFRQLLLRTPPLQLLNRRWDIVSRLSSIATLRPLSWIYRAQLADSIWWLVGIILLLNYPYPSSVSHLVVLAVVAWIDQASGVFQTRLSDGARDNFRVGIQIARGIGSTFLIMEHPPAAATYSYLLTSLFTFPVFPLLLVAQRRWSVFRWRALLALIARGMLTLVKGILVLAAMALVMFAADHLLRVVGTELSVIMEWIDGRIIVMKGYFLYGAQTVVGPLIGVAFTLGFLCYCCRYIRQWLHDRRVFREQMWPTDSVERTWIEETWNELGTVFWRSRFVDQLQLVRSASGVWSAAPPYVGVDRASQRLMALDERWLGLAR